MHAIISLQKWLGSIAWLPSRILRILRVGCAPRALNTALGALAAAQRWQLAAQLFANEKVPQQGAFHALLSHLATLTHWLPSFSRRFFPHHLFGKLVFCVNRRDAAQLKVQWKRPLCGGERSHSSMSLVLSGILQSSSLRGAILHLASIPSFGGGQASPCRPCPSDHFRGLDSPGC